VHDLDAGLALEQLAREMGDAAQPGRTVIDLARLRLSLGDQVGDGVMPKPG